MLSNDTRSKIKNITAGNVIERSKDTCTEIRNYLCIGLPTSTTVKTNFESKLLIKKEQARLLEIYSTENNLWLTTLPVQGTFLAKVGEAMVFLDSDRLNDINASDFVKRRQRCLLN